MSTDCIQCSKSPKKALLISNRNYVKNRLTNGMGNAYGLTECLQILGFECTVCTELDITAMRSAIREFIDGLHPGDIVVLYFTGHSKRIGTSLYNTSLTPKCRIAVASIFKAIREQMQSGQVLYIGDTCSADKRDCHYGNCIPTDQTWFDKYAKRDEHNIEHKSDGRPFKKCMQDVQFTTILASEPGTNAYSDGNTNLSRFTAAIITFLSPLRFMYKCPSESYSIYDFYADVYENIYNAQDQYQKPYMTTSGTRLNIYCSNCDHLRRHAL